MVSVGTHSHYAWGEMHVMPHDSNMYWAMEEPLNFILFPLIGITVQIHNSLTFCSRSR